MTDERDKTIALIRAQTKELLMQCELAELPTVTCGCGKRPIIHWANRCFYCGVYFCRMCAKDHFKTSELDYQAACTHSHKGTGLYSPYKHAWKCDQCGHIRQEA